MFALTNSSRFLADLTFHLDSGLKIRVPNNQYMIPTVDIASNGSRTTNTSKRDILITDVEDEPPILGRYFLTAAYLMVNHDAGTFTLWQANATRERSLVKVFDEETGKKCENTTGVIQPSASYTSSTGNSRPDGGSGSNSGSPSGAAIGGAVVGAIAGAVLIGLGITYFLIRRKQKSGKDFSNTVLARVLTGVTRYVLLLPCARGAAESGYIRDGREPKSWR
jgi:hypothetical protein